MRTTAVFALCCFSIFMLSSVNGQQRESCADVFSFANVEFRATRRSVRRRSGLLNIAHGLPRTDKCSFLRNFLASRGRATCNADLRRCPRQLTAQRRQGFSVPSTVIPNACGTSAPVCDSRMVYRTIDGSCNNLLNPHWGQANRPQVRLVKNDYDDKRQSPRTRGCRNTPLPNPRSVSNAIHRADGPIQFERYLSLFAMQMGQLLIHDCVLSEVFTRPDGSPLECCGVDAGNANCNSITIPFDDTHFTPGTCMDFARSNAVTDCQSVRQVVNTQTPFFDLSLTYGTSDEEAASLRSFVGGKLKHVKNKLPVDFTDSTCVLSRPFDPQDHFCGLAGDGRVMEQPGLASMHTILMREHNRLAYGLSRVNPHWNDERLYQEARKINIGIWQHIIYAEFLPIILGRNGVIKYGLRVRRTGYQDTYNPNTNPLISNGFAAASFRYGHTQVHDLIGLLNAFHQQTTDNLENHFFDPYWYHLRNGTGLEDIIRWISQTRCPFTDKKLQNSIRLNLFKDEEGNSFDLATLNIHRGRDHGIPGYTAYRKFCGLSEVRHFGRGRFGLVDHDVKTADSLKKLYTCVQDIDLFPGMLSELRTGDSLLGPTWQCLISREFKRLRDGDRFFYSRQDRRNPRIGFTLRQLNSIKRMTTSDLICLNSDIQYMRPNAYYFSKRNRPRPCKVRGINFNLWRERNTGY